MHATATPIPGTLTARHWDRERDLEAVRTWWDSHGGERMFPGGLLPPFGVIVEKDGEPVGGLWVYLSVSIGVAFLDSPVTKPGLSRAEASRVMEYALGAAEAGCREHNYSHLIASTLKPIGAWLEKRGFAPAGDRVQLVKLLS